LSEKQAKGIEKSEMTRWAKMSGCEQFGSSRYRVWNRFEGVRGDIDQLKGISSWKKSGWISYIAKKYRQRFPVDVTFCGIIVELVRGF